MADQPPENLRQAPGRLPPLVTPPLCKVLGSGQNNNHSPTRLRQSSRTHALPHIGTHLRQIPPVHTPYQTDPYIGKRLQGRTTPLQTCGSI